MNDIEQIWKDYYTKLYAFVVKRVAEKDAEDILQDVFVKINDGIDGLKTEGKLENWMYRITRNSIIDYYRSKKQIDDLPSIAEELQTDEENEASKEIMSCFAPMILNLPDKYRTALTLSELEGKTQKELAELENLSLSGAKSRVQRGRDLLKKMLEECCQIETDKCQHPISCEKKKDNCKYC